MQGLHPTLCGPHPALPASCPALTWPCLLASLPRAAARQKLADYAREAKHATMFDFVTKGILQVLASILCLCHRVELLCCSPL